MKAKLRQANGTFELVKDNGIVATCPYRDMLTSQQVDSKSVQKLDELQQGGKIRIVQQNQKCTADCSKFQIKAGKDGKDKIYLSCGTGTVYDLEEVIQPDEKNVKSLKHNIKK